MSYARLGLADKIAMILGGGLILIGVVVIGFIETLVSPHSLEPSSTTGDVIIHTAISPTLRAYLIALGLLVWGLYALYRLANRDSTVSTA